MALAFARCMRLLPPLLMLAAAPAAAQPIELRGRGEPALDRILRELVASGDYTVITETRSLGRADTLHGTVVVARATVRIDGTIDGDLIGLGANLFLRPTAVVAGDAVNIAGGLYASELATVLGATRNAPDAPYQVAVRDGAILIGSTDARPRFEGEGLRGVLPPSYDRVDGLTAGAGARLALPYVGSLDPALRGRLEYRTGGALTGGAELVARRDPVRFALGAERTTLTNERWIRARWSNSLAFLFFGNDYYDRYRADRLYADARWRSRLGPFRTTWTVRAQLEEAATLPAGDPWSLFGRTERRPNRPADDGRIASGLLDGRAEYGGRTLIATAGAAIELGRANLDPDRLPADFAPPPGDAHGFARYEAWIGLALAGPFQHTLEIDARVQGPLPGTDVLPLQRWTMVGGDRALFTRPIGAYHGDRLVWIHTTYAVPLPDAIRFPVLGPPTIDLVHVAAMAWQHAEARALEHNLAMRLRAAMLFVRFAIDPSDPSRTDFGVGIAMPPVGRPWERRSD